MSVCRKLPDGTIQKIAGHTILLDANANEVRQGTFDFIPREGSNFCDGTATFTDPMPDTDYVVVVDWKTTSGISQYGRVQAKTTTGFKFEGYYGNDTDRGMYSTQQVNYTAFKPIKLDGYTALQNKVNSPDDTPTIDSMNLVTSDGVARAIENASAVWKGTRAEWNALPATDKKKYDLAVLLDKTLVKAVDRETGDENDVADLTKVFTGTEEEWEALSTTDKTTYALSATSDRKRLHTIDRDTGDVTEVADLSRIWRGTKEEWDELTDEEKDKWDQAEIETIEPKDVNPFRTLSDIEELSIAPNTDYICPHDGFISVQSPVDGEIEVHINGQKYAYSSNAVEGRNVYTIPVCKGDVFKYIATTGAVIRARWYTNEVSPGPTDTPVLYRSQALDWDNKVAVTAAQIYAGYTCPGDGLMCTGVNGATNGVYSTIYVNDVPIFQGYRNAGNTYFFGDHGVVPVSKGDVVKSSDGNVVASYFVPYKDYPDYSTEEHWTGRRWIDGKKIYSKVLVATSPFTLYSGQWTSVPGWIAPENIEFIVHAMYSFSISQSNGSSIRIDSVTGGTQIRAAFQLEGIASYLAGTCLVLEYTKTTD